MMQFTEALLGLYADQGQDTGAGTESEDRDKVWSNTHSSWHSSPL